MGLFDHGKKMKKEKENGCCRATVSVEKPVCGCKGQVSEDKISVCGENRCNIKVLGTGCKSCHEQHENVKKAATKMKLAADIEYITDIEEITGYGVMSMPAIVINEKVVTMGKVLKTEQVVELLKKLGC